MGSKSKVQAANRGRSVSLLGTQIGFHVWNDLALGVPQKTNSCAGRLIWVLEFSPESFEGVLTFATNAVPKKIVFPELFDLFHKMRVFFPFLRIDDLKG